MSAFTAADIYGGVRTSEIGIRLALGATRRAVLWMIIRQVLALLSLGIAIGRPAAWAVSRFVFIDAVGREGNRYPEE